MKQIIYLLLFINIKCFGFCECQPKHFIRSYNNSDIVFIGKLINQNSDSVSLHVIKDLRNNIENIQICLKKEEGACSLQLEYNHEYVFCLRNKKTNLNCCSNIFDLNIYEELLTSINDNTINYYLKNNIIAKGRYNNGLSDGKWEYYYLESVPEFEIIRERYRRGKRNGTSKYYRSTNELREKRLYDDGVLKKVSFYDQNELSGFQIFEDSSITEYGKRQDDGTIKKYYKGILYDQVIVYDKLLEEKIYSVSDIDSFICNDSIPLKQIKEEYKDGILCKRSLINTFKYLTLDQNTEWIEYYNKEGILVEYLKGKPFIEDDFVVGYSYNENSDKEMVKNGTGFYRSTKEIYQKSFGAKTTYMVGALTDSLKQGLWYLGNESIHDVNIYRDNILISSKRYNTNNKLIAEYLDEDTLKINKTYNRKGQLYRELIIKGGTVYKKQYYDTGQLYKIESRSENECFKLIKSYTPEGIPMVIDGKGKHINYTLQGEIINDN